MFLGRSCGCNQGKIPAHVVFSCQTDLLSWQRSFHTTTSSRNPLMMVAAVSIVVCLAMEVCKLSWFEYGRIPNVVTMPVAFPVALRCLHRVLFSLSFPLGLVLLELLWSNQRAASNSNLEFSFCLVLHLRNWEESEWFRFLVANFASLTVRETSISVNRSNGVCIFYFQFHASVWWFVVEACFEETE